MGEVGCLKDGHFQNLQVKGNVNSLGTMNMGGGGVIFGGGIGVITSASDTTITAALMLDNSVLDYEAGSTNATDIVWDTGTNIETALVARGVVPQNGMSFDVYINNADNAVFIWAALAAGITSGSGAASADNCQLPVAAAGLSGSGHFRFVRTGANAYTVFNLGTAAS
jgi:hypothetical protein